LEQYEERIEAQIDSKASFKNGFFPDDVPVTSPRVSAGCDGATGVHSSNTPPSSSTLDEIKKWSGAEDWLEVCLYINWTNWRKLNKRLKSAKEDAAVEGAPPGFCDIQFMGGTATVDPGGARLGGKKGPYFAYKLQFDEITILIAEREQAHKTFPSAVVRINGEACLYPGANECYQKALMMFRELGGPIIRNRLSRVDICLDMPEVDIEPFDRAFLEERYICRAVSKSRHSGTGVTVSIGKSPLMCRIYDKKAEVELKANPHKNLCMRILRWKSCEIPDCAIRVEFELRRDALKERGIDTVEDYYAKRADLVHYLTTNWLRFTANKVDRENKNQSKARTLPLWNRVRKAFKAWAGNPTGEPLTPLDKEQADVKNLLKQLMGVGQTAAEYQGQKVETIEELLAYIGSSTSKYGIKPKRRK
jgi:hypothetical protein